MKLDLKTKSKLYKLSELIHKLKVKAINKQPITFEEISNIDIRLDTITEVFKNYKEITGMNSKQNRYLKYVAFIKNKQQKG